MSGVGAAAGKGHLAHLVYRPQCLFPPKLRQFVQFVHRAVGKYCCRGVFNGPSLIATYHLLPITRLGTLPVSPPFLFTHMIYRRSAQDTKNSPSILIQSLPLPIANLPNCCQLQDSTAKLPRDLHVQGKWGGDHTTYRQTFK